MILRIGDYPYDLSRVASNRLPSIEVLARGLSRLPRFPYAVLPYMVAQHCADLAREARIAGDPESAWVLLGYRIQEPILLGVSGVAFMDPGRVRALREAQPDLDAKITKNVRATFGFSEPSDAVRARILRKSAEEASFYLGVSRAGDAGTSLPLALSPTVACQLWLSEYEKLR